MKSIKLMTDYDAYPLWWVGPEMVGDVDPTTLPLSGDTVSRLIQWKRAYDEHLNWQDPKASHFFTDQQLEAFEKEGLALWHRLREELEQKYEVWYFSWKTQKLLKSPSETQT